MEDKAQETKLFEQIDIMLNNLTESIAQLRYALLALKADPQFIADLRDPNCPFYNAPQLTSDIVRAYMSGRWRRRDGASFATVHQPNRTVGSVHDANDPSGDLRPTDLG
jgi:hypothetical protein